MMQPAGGTAALARTAADGTAQILLDLIARNRWAEALECARMMTTNAPTHGCGWKFLGGLLWEQGCRDEALAAMQTAARLLPEDAEAQCNLGICLAAVHRNEEAATAFRLTLSIDPGNAAAHYRLGMYFESLGRYADAELSLRTALSLPSQFLSVDPARAFSNLLYLADYGENVDPDARFADHCRFGELVEHPLRRSWPLHPNTRTAERRLQIGFVSGDLRDHSVATFFEPIATRLAQRAGLELHAYYSRDVADGVTDRLRKNFAHWQPVGGLTDAELARRISADAIDILIDLSGHTAENRLPAFARKPAPIQVSWLGYPGTTGLKAVDYYLADPLWLPPGRFNRLFTEKLVYLPDRWAFELDPDAPTVGSLPALQTGRLTFASFHRQGKINAATVRLWSSLLRALPDSRLLLAGLPHDGSQYPLIDLFASHGIGAERLRLHPRCTKATYLELHQQVDIALDSYPYCGATTSMHSLSMGVPTLTIAGPTPAAHAGAGILAQAGIKGFAATDAADFVAKGLHWSNHLHELAQLRAGMRTRLDQSPGGQPDLIAAHLEGALRHMWRRWCNELPPASFATAELCGR